MMGAVRKGLGRWGTLRHFLLSSGTRKGVVRLALPLLELRVSGNLLSSTIEPCCLMGWSIRKVVVLINAIHAISTCDAIRKPS